MKLRDTASRDGYFCSFFALHDDRLPIPCTHGLLDAFPFWAYWEGHVPEYQRAFPSRSPWTQPWIGQELDRNRMPIPWPKALSPLLMKYLQQVFYWTRAMASEFRLPLDELKRLSHNDVDFFVQECMGMPWKFRKKVGLPYNIKK